MSSLLTNEERAWYAEALRRVKAGEVKPEEAIELVEELRDVLEDLNELRRIIRELLVAVLQGSASQSPPTLS